jgi:hypothetical protein
VRDIDGGGSGGECFYIFKYTNQEHIPISGNNGFWHRCGALINQAITAGLCCNVDQIFCLGVVLEVRVQRG